MTEPPPVVDTNHNDDRTNHKSNQFARMLNHRPTMFVMLFGVTGFLGIPFLWKSTAFSRSEKILWSTLVTLYTCTLLWTTGSILWWCFGRMQESLGL